MNNNNKIIQISQHGNVKIVLVWTKKYSL